MTNRKIDRQRISRQIYEIAYCRKLAKKILKNKYSTGRKIPIEKRVAKALLKYTKGYTKK